MRLTEYARRVDHERNPLVWIAKLIRRVYANLWYQGV